MKLLPKEISWLLCHWCGSSSTRRVRCWARSPSCEAV